MERREKGLVWVVCGCPHPTTHAKSYRHLKSYLNTDMDFLFLILLFLFCISVSSVQFSRSVVSDSLRPYEPQHARAPCPSPTPGVYSNSSASSRRCHPAISSSVVPFSSCPQSLPASGSFPMSQLFSI